MAGLALLAVTTMLARSYGYYDYYGYYNNEKPSPWATNQYVSQRITEECKYRQTPFYFYIETSGGIIVFNIFFPPFSLNTTVSTSI